MHTLTLATWNIAKSKLVDSLDALHTTGHYDAVAVTEILPPLRTTHQEYKGRYHVLHDARPPRTRSGYAAIALPTRLRMNITHTHVTQHSVAVRTSDETRDYFFISIYLPPAMTRHTIGGAFEQLEAWQASCPQSHVITIAGDMNTELHHDAIREAELDAWGASYSFATHFAASELSEYEKAVTLWPQREGADAPKSETVV